MDLNQFYMFIHVIVINISIHQGTPKQFNNTYLKYMK